MPPIASQGLHEPSKPQGLPESPRVSAGSPEPPTASQGLPGLPKVSRAFAGHFRASAHALPNLPIASRASHSFRKHLSQPQRSPKASQSVPCPAAQIPEAPQSLPEIPRCPGSLPGPPRALRELRGPRGQSRALQWCASQNTRRSNRKGLENNTKTSDSTTSEPRGSYAKSATATEDTESLCPFTPRREAWLAQLAGGVIASLWSSSPSRPPTANPARPRCLTYRFK